MEATTLGRIKVNVDAVYRNGKVGYGFIVRDEIGTILLAGASLLASMVSVAHEKLMGFWHSIEEYL